MIHSRRLLAAVAVTVLALIGIVACSHNGAADTAPKTAEHYLHAIGNKDSGAACRLFVDLDHEKKPLTKDSKHWDDCVSGVKELVSKSSKTDLKKFKNADVKSADVDGRKATIRGRDIAGVDIGNDDSGFSLVKIKDKWYIVFD
jgi:hypothetical protein